MDLIPGVVLGLTVVVLERTARWLWAHRRHVDFPTRPFTVAHQVLASRWLLEDLPLLEPLLEQGRARVAVLAAREADFEADEDWSAWPVTVYTRTDPTTGLVLLLVECRVPPLPEPKEP